MGGLLFVQGADDGHFRGVPGSADDVEGAFVHGLKIKLPFAEARGHDHARNFLFMVFSMNQVGVTAVR